MIVPGVVSATFRSKSAEDIIRLCKAADLKAVEWSENAHVMPGDAEGAKALYEKTTAAGLAVAAYGSYYRLGQNENPEEAFMASLVSAKALHASVIRVWAGNEASAEASEEKRNSIAREAARIGALAEKEGIKVAFEWHRKTLTDTNESAMELLKKANQDNLYCLWQPTLALSMKERMEGLDLLRSGERLLNLHIYYWPEDGVRLPLEDGFEIWKQYLEHVDKSEDRYGLLEFVKDNTEEQFLEDAKTLHKLLEA